MKHTPLTPTVVLAAACMLSMHAAWPADASTDAVRDAPAIVHAIRAGHVIDVVSGKVLSKQVIVVRGERIEALGPEGAVQVPSDARWVDLSTSTVLPGLIDAHTHITSDPTLPPFFDYGLSNPRIALQGAAHARKTLLAGVTTIRDVGASGYTDIALRDAIDAGDVPGPHMVVSGLMIGSTGGHCDENMLAPEFKYEAEGVANGVDGVRLAVRRNVKYGADLIKFCATGGVFSKGDTPGAVQYTAAEMNAVVEEAHMQGRRVAAHAHGAEGIKQALRAGVDTIEHASFIDDEGLALAKKLGAYLSMDIYNTDYTQAEGPKRGELEEFLRKDREVGEVQRQNFSKAVKQGVKLIYGTDAGVYPHGDNAKQLVIMVRYGMTPMQALQAATLHSADAVGLSQSAGRIAVGYRADIIAVSGDPLADIALLQAVRFVMKSGQIYKHESSRAP